MTEAARLATTGESDLERPATDVDARVGAQVTWNGRACGAVDGFDETNVTYFDAVEAARYHQQAWQKKHFDFERYAGKDVLEIGVGHGTDLKQFAVAGARCAGVDITDKHLELTERNFALRGLPVDLRYADATALPFEDASFDCVYSFGVVHHIPEVERVISEVYRVLRPGGESLITVYNRNSAFVAQLAFWGLIEGRLFTLGWDGVKARIEGGADGRTAKPYVRLYGKKEFGRLFTAFRLEDLSIHQFQPNQVIPQRLLGRLGYVELPFGGRFGWYITAKARKLGV